MRPSPPVTLAIFGDTHVTGTTSLIHGDGMALDDGGQYIPSKSQRLLLWQPWLEYVELVKHLAKGSKLWVIGNGDLVEGDAKKRSNQVATRNRADILDITYKTLRPLIDIADRVFIVRGTAAHTGKSAELERAFADDIGAEPDGEDNRAWWWLPLEASGVQLEIAHHSVMGNRAWTAGGGTVRLANETIIEYAGHGERVPDLVIRGHVHRWHDSFDNAPQCRALTHGAWQLATEYTHRIAVGMRLAHIGALIIRCKNGRYEITKFQRYPKRLQPWKESAKQKQ